MINPELHTHGDIKNERIVVLDSCPRCGGPHLLMHETSDIECAEIIWHFGCKDCDWTVQLGVPVLMLHDGSLKKILMEFRDRTLELERQRKELPCPNKQLSMMPPL